MVVHAAKSAVEFNVAKRATFDSIAAYMCLCPLCFSICNSTYCQKASRKRSRPFAESAAEGSNECCWKCSKYVCTLLNVQQKVLLMRLAKLLRNVLLGIHHKLLLGHASKSAAHFAIQTATGSLLRFPDAPKLAGCGRVCAILTLWAPWQAFAAPNMHWCARARSVSPWTSSKGHWSVAVARLSKVPQAWRFWHYGIWEEIASHSGFHYLEAVQNASLSAKAFPATMEHSNIWWRAPSLTDMFVKGKPILAMSLGILAILLGLVVQCMCPKGLPITCGVHEQIYIARCCYAWCSKSFIQICMLHSARRCHVKWHWSFVIYNLLLLLLLLKKCCSICSNNGCFHLRRPQAC